MDLSGVNFRPLYPILVSHWQELLEGGHTLAELIDFTALLAINGSIVNRLFREANVPGHESAHILNIRYSKKKAVDKRNQRARDKTSLRGLSSEVSVLLETKQTLEEERNNLIYEIEIFQKLNPLFVY